MRYITPIRIPDGPWRVLASRRVSLSQIVREVLCLAWSLDDCSVVFLLMASPTGGKCLSFVFKLGNDVNKTRDGTESGLKIQKKSLAVVGMSHENSV